MQYHHIVPGEFISRQNRFTARVRIGEIVETVHIKNTGRCRELLIPGVSVALEKAASPNRKTGYDLVAVKKENLGWVNIDSQILNGVVGEWLERRPHPFEDVTTVHPEYRYGNSRIDYYLEGPNRRVLLEVKGCTLEIDGQGYFPDAPTSRGTKHLRELMGAVQEGYEAYIVYCIAMEGVTHVLSNESIDPAYAAAFREAVAAGVKPIYLLCRVTENSICAAQ